MSLLRNFLVINMYDTRSLLHFPMVKFLVAGKACAIGDTAVGHFNMHHLI